MKKYFIADLLTLFRAVLSVALFTLCLVVKEPLGWWAVAIYGVGLITDAADGEFARKYRYPNDDVSKRKYWWRKYHGMYDTLADIMLSLACLYYYSTYVNTSTACFILGFGLGGSLAVQLAYYLSGYGNDETLAKQEAIRLLVLARRFAFVGIELGGLFALIYIAPGPVLLKIVIVIKAILGGLTVWKMKRKTRANEITTEL